MSKLFLLLILLSASSVALGAETVIVLQEFGIRGEKGLRETVIAGQGFLMVNAQKLSPEEIITQSQHIKKISQFKTVSPTDSSCGTGRFEHILKQGKKLRKETGCLESARFAELKASFQALAKDSLSSK